MKINVTLPVLSAILLTTVVAAFGATSAWAQREEDPLVTFSYMLEIGGQVAGFFVSVEGIGSSSEVIEQRVTNPDTGETINRKIPGRLSFSDVTLKRGITSNMDIWDWRRLVESGDMDEARSNITITMLDQQAAPVAIWNFTNAWPSKINAPNDPNDADAFGIEMITLVHEGYERVVP